MVVAVSYLVHYDVLFTKCDRYYYKMRELFYYKMRQIFIDKRLCDSFITNCDSYYKIRPHRQL